MLKSGRAHSKQGDRRSGTDQDSRRRDDVARLAAHVSHVFLSWLFPPPPLFDLHRSRRIFIEAASSALRRAICTLIGVWCLVLSPCACVSDAAELEYGCGWWTLCVRCAQGTQQKRDGRQSRIRLSMVNIRVRKSLIRQVVVEQAFSKQVRRVEYPTFVSLWTSSCRRGTTLRAAVGLIRADGRLASFASSASTCVHLLLVLYCNLCFETKDLTRMGARFFVRLAPEVHPRQCAALITPSS